METKISNLIEWLEEMKVNINIDKGVEDSFIPGIDIRLLMTD